jgi:hypothetical protein
MSLEHTWRGLITCGQLSIGLTCNEADAARGPLIAGYQPAPLAQPSVANLKGGFSEPD